MVFSTHTQPFVKLVTVDHANETTFTRDIHFFVRRRHHAGRTCFGHQQFIGNLEIFDQARRNRPAARLDAALAVQQQHAVSVLGQIVCGGRTRRATTHHHHVIGIIFHTSSPDFRIDSNQDFMPQPLRQAAMQTR